MSTASAVEREMLALINQERTSRGLDPLQLETQLNDSSEDHSAWMLDTDRFSHTGAGGSSATQRMQAAGFDLEGSWRTGENIAWQSERGAPGISDDVAQLHENLMNSPGHRANILNPDFKYIGIGIETGDMQGYDAIMVTQNFAATSADVILDDGVPASDPVPMPLAEDVSEPVEDVEEPIEEDVAEPVEDVDEPIEEDVAEPVEDVDEPIEEDVAEPVEDVDEPIEEDVAEPVEDVDEPIEEDVAEPVEDVDDPIEEDVAEPVEEDTPDVVEFDVAGFLAEIEAFVTALQARFDQFDWNVPEQDDPASGANEFEFTFRFDFSDDDIIETDIDVAEDTTDDVCCVPFFDTTCGFDFV
ncbi:allergen V5/Tpx-1 family protein [Ruegeria sp. ANG-S4]|uniref:CAP domain-containing protein n=1 Tax=Ruegeria sp. ANG-S4 TaxID=1577904 RepID=UPI00057FC871|nr:CAP domain-containing protein [Ruegeria sp. ANG-S4]KIC46469.1 allergen V5/Tpx-1 family protein [Ruegeria sp. ANG-S4]